MAAVMGRRNPYRPYWSKTNRVYLVECGSKQLVEILYDAMNSLENLIWRHRIRFLKGIYNAEGCITVRLRRGHVYPRVYLTNSNRALLNLARRMLKSIEIETTVELNTKAGKARVILGRRTSTNSDVCNVCIGRLRYFVRFARMIGFGIIRKQTLLRSVLRQILVRGVSLEATLPSRG